jgi:hypothetical protein
MITSEAEKLVDERLNDSCHAPTMVPLMVFGRSHAGRITPSTELTSSHDYLRLHKTPELGVHQTGKPPVSPVSLNQPCAAGAIGTVLSAASAEGARLVSRVALEMFLDWDEKALRAYQAGDRASW